MTEIAARIAAAAGDPAALLVLAIELAQENAQLAERASGLEAAESDRKAKQNSRVRKHRRNALQRDETLQGVTQRDVTDGDVAERDATDTLSPLVSLLPPEPPNNSSHPPLQLPPPRSSEEQRLYDRAPEVEPVALRFLDGKDETARAAWIGRFHGAMDRPPHATGRELADALEELMTKPREDWVPALFRQYVTRIRRDATRDAERTTTPGVRSFGRSSQSAQEFAAAAADWDMIKENNLLTSWPMAELHAIGDTLVAAGKFASRDAFLAWYRVAKPVELREARTDRWAVEQLVDRRAARQAIAS